jgi:hypothetical protein
LFFPQLQAPVRNPAALARLLAGRLWALFKGATGETFAAFKK